MRIRWSTGREKLELIRRRLAWLLLIPLLAIGSRSAWDTVAYATSLRIYVIPTSSMAPTIAPGDHIGVATPRGTKPGRGEVWVFSTPVPNGCTSVKRIVGLPGEIVEVAGGRVLIDGKPLAEPYIAGPINYAMPPVHLGGDEYFVLGDNRNVSSDSHVWGPLPGGRLIGRAEFRPWPPSRIGELR